MTDLFGNAGEQPQRTLTNELLTYPRRLQEMHLLHGGDADGRKCGKCRWLINSRGDTANVYYKCSLGEMTHGPGTDWRCRWPACGKFEGRKEKS